jgi:hypothetical protein
MSTTYYEYTLKPTGFIDQVAILDRDGDFITNATDLADAQWIIDCWKDAR